MMAEHEPCIGQSDDWYTPREIFAALNLIFDLDPCSPGPDHWVPAKNIFTKVDDGLRQSWDIVEYVDDGFVCECPCHYSLNAAHAPSISQQRSFTHVKRQAAYAGLVAIAGHVVGNSKDPKNGLGPTDHPQRPNGRGSFIEPERASHPIITDAQNAGTFDRHISTISHFALTEDGIAGARAAIVNTPVQNRRRGDSTPLRQQRFAQKNSATSRLTGVENGGENKRSLLTLDDGSATLADRSIGVRINGSCANPHGTTPVPIAGLTVHSHKSTLFPSPQPISQVPCHRTCSRPAAPAITESGTGTPSNLLALTDRKRESCHICKAKNCRSWIRRALVFVNPPFGGRNGHVPWLVKFLDHGNGVAIVRAYTSSAWFHEHVAPRAETILFPKGKTKFIRPDGSVGSAPGHGVVLIGMGTIACAALRQCGLGLCIDLAGKGRQSR